ncbi:GAF domain protein [Janibacter sp. HTCC2649]|uniref:helix-turn-helix domain-containing protein n=1 Tax=Janibacter sp. HTCC2649 TaxID=313589 RepID=UPI000066ECFE|nr:helix-turn-helix domain-containing protein [Janibacter sp. HTCC2649]EAP98892.1 GAF domain protein [Janibacter sp. HTCC2649]
MHDDVDVGTRLLEMLASGASAGDLASLDVDPHARDLAIRISGAFDVQRRREQQLAALVDTAGELASMSDPSVVLDAIVRRARTLMGTDVAYLTLFDHERGDTYMRATAGSVSAQFQVVRLAFGAGLGGLVAQSHKPYWTADYFADARFRHTHSIDGAVGDEGLVAICGTPLLVKDEFVGVLFASNRTPRPFTHDEVALLGSLAALAAVTIVQVRAVEEATRTLAALSNATDRVSHYAAGIERAAAAHDRFAEIVLEGGGVDDLTESLTQLLGGWALLLDLEGMPRSIAGESPPSGEALTDLTAQLEGGVEGGRLSRVGDAWAIGIAAAGEPLGSLVIGEVSSMDDSDERTVERAAVVTALVLLGERNRAETRQQQRTDLVSGLVSGHADLGLLLPAARSLGLDLREPSCLLAVLGTEAATARSLVLAVNAALGGVGLVGEVEGHVVALLPGVEPGSAATDLAQRLSRNQIVTVGAAGPVSEAGGTLGTDLAAAHTEAVRTAEALVALGRRGDGAAAADLGFAGLIVGTQPEVTAYVHSVLGPLHDYDMSRGTDLVGTLEAYFLAGASPRHAATRLHVHTNTVAQRLERITRLVGDGWQSPERALELQLALRLRHLVAAG